MARATATSPSGCASRWNAIGATKTGSDVSEPSTRHVVERRLTSPALPVSRDPIMAIGTDVSPEVFDPFKQDEAIKMRRLFDAASAHYMRAVLLRRLRDHAPAGSGLSGLRALFLSLLHEPGEETHGCLITNSAIEFGDARRPKFVSDGFAILRDAFADRLTEARQVAEQGAEALALLALYQGVLVLVRGGFDRSALETMVMQFFDDMEKHNGT
jgi:hypothetical protein